MVKLIKLLKEVEKLSKKDPKAAKAKLVGAISEIETILLRMLAKEQKQLYDLVRELNKIERGLLPFDALPGAIRFAKQIKLEELKTEHLM